MKLVQISKVIELMSSSTFELQSSFISLHNTLINRSLAKLHALRFNAKLLEAWLNL